MVGQVLHIKMSEVWAEVDMGQLSAQIKKIKRVVLRRSMDNQVVISVCQVVCKLPQSETIKWG